jgi:hypothetical protein
MTSPATPAGSTVGCVTVIYLTLDNSRENVSRGSIEVFSPRRTSPGANFRRFHE